MTSHSSGEVAAAFAAKAIDIREAMFILYSRGILLDSLRKKSALKGSMMAVGAEREVVERYISEVAPHGLVIACLNSPSSITVSGDSIAINELGKKLSDAKVFARKLKVNVAFHSHHMKPLEFDYLQALQKGLKKRAIGDIIYSSPVTGNVVPTGEILPSEHWTRSMLQPVLFSDALASMCVRPDPSRSRPVKQVDILIEIGPHSALAGPVRQTLASPALKGLDLLYSSALIRDKDAVETMQSLVCFLAGKGYRSKLDCVNLSGWRDKLEVLTDLPSYPWTHQTRHWLEPRLNKDHRFKRHPTHEFLGSAMDGEHKDTPKWRHIIRASDMPWIHDHRVQSDIIYPGAGFICMAIQAIHQLATAETTPHGYLLEDVEILKAVVVPNTPVGIEVQLTLKRYTERDLGREGWYDFSITSVMDGDVWTEHCKGRIAVQDEKKTHTFVCKPFGRENGSFIRSIDPQDLYSSLRAVGVYHGPSFQNILRIQANKRQSLSTFAIAETGSMMPAEVEQPHVIHPTTLDSVFLATYSALYNVGSKQSSAMVPRSIKRMFVSCAISSRPGYRYDAQATLHTHHPQGFRASVFIGGTDGDPALAVDGLYCQSLGDVSAHNDQSAYTNRALTIHWAPDMDLNPPSIFEGALRHAPVQSERMIVAELRQACYHFIHDALEALTDEDLEQLLWHHKAMFAWMQAQEHKASLNLLGDTSSDWSRASKREKELLVERVSRASIDGRMSCRIGKSLVSIFRREVAPLQIMLEDKLLYDYYRQALRIDRSYEQIKQLIDVAAHKNPKARVLEIGGGTGGCTVHALQVLGGGNSGRPTRFAHYDFTDISSGFFEMARQKFEAWGDLIHYTKLDVEVDPVAQGFEEGSYDLILACQVLHATKNMCRTLQNVRKLLRPGGKLMMIETTNDAIDIQIIFGTLPGWWLS